LVSHPPTKGGSKGPTSPQGIQATGTQERGKLPPFRLPGGGRAPVVIEPGAALPGGRPFVSRAMTGRKRRRMNPLNVKALRRSTRRLAAFQKEATKVNKELRKLAPPSSRRRRPSAADIHHAK